MWSKEILEDNNLVEITSDDCFLVDLIYANENNIMAMSVYDITNQGKQCIVHKDLMHNLDKLRPMLKQHNLKLKICDAYRHPKSHEKCLEIIPAKGFFAKTPDNSQHCRACAIDVILVDSNNEELDFPCKVDGYDIKFVEAIKNGDFDVFFEHLKKANYNYIGNGTKNRDFLRKIMEEVGFIALEHEWWHFNMEPRDANPPKYKTIELPLENKQ